METNLNIITNTPKYTGVQNSIPVLLDIDYDIDIISNYTLNTYVVYDPNVIQNIIPINDYSSYIIFENVITDIFKEGGNIFLFTDLPNGNNILNGTYNILKQVDNFTIIVNYPYQYNFLSTQYTAGFNYFKYKHEPDLNNKIRLDLQTTLKDYVGKGLLPGSLQYDFYVDGNDYIQYGLIFGEEYNYTFNFDDNYNDNGYLGFVNSDYTSVNDVPFKIGDAVNITQIVQEWEYTDNQFISGSLGFISTNIHNFTERDLVYVSGQITHPSYNGYATVIEVPDQYTIVVDKSFVSASPTEGGKIYGNPVPQYSGNTKIIDIKYVVGTGVIITVDKQHNESTQPIKGKMNLISNKKFGNTVTITNFIDSNTLDFKYAFLNRFDNRYLNSIYANNLNHIDLFNNYVIDSKNDITLYKASTILSDYQDNLIDIDTNGFITYRFDDDFDFDTVKAVYTFYNDNNVIGQSYIQLNKEISNYILTGINVLIEFGILTDIAPFDLENDLHLINRFDIRIVTTTDDIETEKTIPLSFSIKKECNNLPNNYSLIWLDANGSYISYPFNYLPEKTTDVTRTNYYTQNLNTNNIGNVLPNDLRGSNEFYNKSTDKIKLTSDWLKDNENILFEDLIRSTDVYLQITDDKNKHKYITPVILEDKTINYKTNYNNEVLFNYTPTVSFANNDYRFNNYAIALNKYINI